MTRRLRLAAASAAGLLLVLASISIVGRDEQGVITRFGAVSRVVTSGVQVTLPWPIERLQRVSTTQVRTAAIDVGVDPVRPGRTRFREDAQWLTGDTNIVELKVAIQYVVADPTRYLFGAVDPTGEDGAVELAARAALTRLVARMPIDDALSVGKAQLQLDARDAVQKLLDTLQTGLRVLAVNIAEARPPTEVIAAFNDVSSAESDRERLLSEADGYRRDLVPTRESEAESMLQQARIDKDQQERSARGAAARFAALAAEIVAAGDPELAKRRLWLDAVTAVLARAKTIVYPRDETGGNFVLRVPR